MNKMLRVAVGGGGSADWCNVSAANYDSVNLDVSGQDTAPTGLAFKPDGTKMYVIGYVSDRVHQYTLSTAWDLDTASYDSVSFSVRSQESFPRDVAFKPDGTKMYVVGSSSDTVYQYTLSTAWDLYTASYDSVDFDVAAGPTSATFKPDGTKMYVIGSVNDKVYQYSLG